MRCRCKRKPGVSVRPASFRRLRAAEKFVEAANTYASNPTAFHLRAMNMLCEGLKQNSTIVVVPNTAADSMQPGGIAWLTALTMEPGRQQIAIDRTAWFIGRLSLILRRLLGGNIS
jgi:hypothetical protein